MKRWAYILLIFILMSFLLSCSNSDVTPGYKEFTLHRNRAAVAYFSFEYPEGFEKLGNSYIDSEYVRISFYRSLLEEGYWDAWFNVRVYRYPMFDHSSAAAAIEDEIQTSTTLFEDFKILKRTPVLVDNVEGELLVYSYIPIKQTDEYSYLKGHPIVISRNIYFDYNGLIWTIDMASVEEVAEADEAVWEHLLETFKILD